MEKDPYNVVVAGVGGQGNVVGTQLMGAVLVNQGYKVTIGETYGASQRGGSVMSHMRVSMAYQYGPLIPPRCADLVVALEPTEAVRVLAQYGNRNTLSVVNTRAIFPVDVISGDLSYPKKEALINKITLCPKSLFSGGHGESSGTGQSNSRQYHHDRGSFRSRYSSNNRQRSGEGDNREHLSGQGGH